MNETETEVGPPRDAAETAVPSEDMGVECNCFIFNKVRVAGAFIHSFLFKKKVPPHNSPAHSKLFYSELDKIICLVYENEKISCSRREEFREVMGRLEEAIKQKLPDVEFQLEVFGSTENGFGSNRSDLDVSFRYAENMEKSRGGKRAGLYNAIRIIEDGLRCGGFDRVTSIKTAKVPVVKFTTCVGSGIIEGDISYYNELALHNTQLLKRYCEWTNDDVLSKLGMFIKRWAKECDICDASKGSLSTYTYIILLIHFLQRLQPHPLLPVLQEVGEKKVIQVDGWDVYFCDDAPTPDWSLCTLSVGELFLQFLYYFAKFDWHDQIVQISQTNQLTKGDRGWLKTPMCVQDPFDLNRNLGFRISDEMFAFIIKSFVTSHEVFSSLKERDAFTVHGCIEGDSPIDDGLISKFGDALLAKCRESIGPVPCNIRCFKCGSTDHLTHLCPIPGGHQIPAPVVYPQISPSEGVDPFALLKSCEGAKRKMEGNVAKRFSLLRDRFDRCDKKRFVRQLRELFGKHEVECTLCQVTVVSMVMVEHICGRKHIRALKGSVCEDAFDFWWCAVDAVLPGDGGVTVAIESSFDIPPSSTVPYPNPTTTIDDSPHQVSSIEVASVDSSPALGNDGKELP